MRIQCIPGIAPVSINTRIEGTCLSKVQSRKGSFRSLKSTCHPPPEFIYFVSLQQRLTAVHPQHYIGCPCNVRVTLGGSRPRLYDAKTRFCSLNQIIFPPNPWSVRILQVVTHLNPVSPSPWIFSTSTYNLLGRGQVPLTSGSWT